MAILNKAYLNKISAGLRGGALLAAFSVLYSCAPLVEIGGSDGPPARIFDIAPDTRTATPATLPVPAVILVEEPTASSLLERDRVAVRMAGGEIQYLPGLRFADHPARLIRRVIKDDLDGVDGLTALGRGALDVPSDYRLKIIVRDFQINVASTGREESAVSVQALLVDQAGALMASQTFSRTTALASAAPAAAIASLSEGLSAATQDLRAWLLSLLNDAGAR